MSIRVGIDLGTTYSAVAYVDPKTKEPKIIPNGDGNKITPSVIWFDGDEIIFGSGAANAFRAGDPNCAATFKRNIGTADPPHCTIDGISYTAEKLSEMLLRHLKAEAEMGSGETIEGAVITVPAYFRDPEREATMRAAKAAGLPCLRLIDEPNAAAMYYGLSHWRKNANILVYDLGGGTFDVTLIHMGEDGKLITVVTRGDHMLGGKDWDEKLQTLLIERLEDATDLAISDNVESTALVRGKAEDVKRTLSKMNTAKVDISFPDYGRATVSVTREEFERNTRDLLDRTGALCDAVLEEAKISPDRVADILLVGGSTRMPQVSAYLEQKFGKKPLAHVNPDEAVALGAAIQADNIVGRHLVYNETTIVQDEHGNKVVDRSKSGILESLPEEPEHRLRGVGLLQPIETTAHALGVVAINDEQNCYYNEIIIPANHPRPVRLAKRFRYYTKPKQPGTVDIYMVQGVGLRPGECSIPYKYTVSGIRHIKNGDTLGTVIRVQYSYDENGIIHVQARQEDDTTDLPIEKVDSSINVYDFNRPLSDHVGANRVVNVAGGGNIHKYKSITFSNVQWKPFDRIPIHEDGSRFHEPKVHKIFNEKRIEFHGYNISRMDEGVTYTIGAHDGFEIACNIDTSTIMPHPGGALVIRLGLISAELNQNGGNMMLDDQSVAKVGSKFHLKMALSESGKYEIWIDGKSVGSKEKKTAGSTDITFSFHHDSHYCESLSHATVSNIQMTQCMGGTGDDSSDTPTWDD